MRATVQNKIRETKREGEGGREEGGRGTGKYKHGAIEETGRDQNLRNKKT